MIPSMTHGARGSGRLVAASLIDWIGTGFYLAISAIFLTRSVGLTPSQVGLALAGAGVVVGSLVTPAAARRARSRPVVVRIQADLPPLVPFAVQPA